MAAEVETMMYVGQVPWHGLGTYVGNDPVTSKEAIIAAGLNWNVKLSSLYHGDMLPAPTLHDVKTHHAVVRESDNHILGVVGNRYQPVQNVDAFEFMDGLVKDKSMRYHTAGSLREGKRVWLLGKVGSFDAVPGDQVDKYLFLWNSHDGSTALRCMFTTVRVVCANTARVALSGQGSDSICLYHTKNIKDSMYEAKEVLGLAQTNFSMFEAFSKTAVNKQINTADLDTFVKRLFPDSPNVVKRAYATERARSEVTRLFEDGTGNNLPGVAGTAWAAYNAVTEYSNYYRSSRGTNKQERRFEYTMFGSGVNLIDKAQVLLAAA